MGVTNALTQALTLFEAVESAKPGLELLQAFLEVEVGHGEYVLRPSVDELSHLV